MINNNTFDGTSSNEASNSTLTNGQQQINDAQNSKENNKFIDQNVPSEQKHLQQQPQSYIYGDLGDNNYIYQLRSTSNRNNLDCNNNLNNNSTANNGNSAQACQIQPDINNNTQIMNRNESSKPTESYISGGGAVKRGYDFIDGVDNEGDDDYQVSNPRASSILLSNNYYNNNVMANSTSNYGRRSPPKKPKFLVTYKEMREFFSLLDDESINQFLKRDSCCLISDKYALAMVFTYFKRAKFSLNEFTCGNFYLALYLASDIEEDVDEYKYEIFPWALGIKWRTKFSSFLRKRDALLRRIGYRAIVSRKCCEEVMSLLPEHFAWKRERHENHGGATRAYLINRSRRFFSNRNNMEEDELNLPPGPNDPPRPCPLCLINSGSYNLKSPSLYLRPTTQNLIPTMVNLPLQPPPHQLMIRTGKYQLSHNQDINNNNNSNSYLLNETSSTITTDSLNVNDSTISSNTTISMNSSSSQTKNSKIRKEDQQNDSLENESEVKIAKTPKKIIKETLIKEYEPVIINARPAIQNRIANENSICSDINSSYISSVNTTQSSLHVDINFSNVQTANIQVNNGKYINMTFNNNLNHPVANKITKLSTNENTFMFNSSSVYNKHLDSPKQSVSEVNSHAPLTAIKFPSVTSVGSLIVKDHITTSDDEDDDEDEDEDDEDDEDEVFSASSTILSNHCDKSNSYLRTQQLLKKHEHAIRFTNRRPLHQSRSSKKRLHFSLGAAGNAIISSSVSASTLSSAQANTQSSSIVDANQAQIDQLVPREIVPTRNP